jgi:flagellar hook-associated protein 1 FlgK
MADLFQIGLSGIYSSQAKLNTTGHNIANINTEGYSRQTVEVTTGGADRFGDYFIGRGSIVAGIERAYDKFAFTENISNTSQLSYSTEVYQQTNQMDMLLSNENTSITKPVLDVFKSLNGVADHPNMLESRKVFLESATNMVSQYNRLYDNLEIQYNSINTDIANTAQTITTLADNLANVNQQISAVLGAGGQSNANDLLDQRDQAITDLSQYVDVSVVPAENGMVNVFIGSGQSLVMGGTALQMKAVNGDPDPSRKQLAFSINGNISLLDGQRLGGKVAGLFDVRNNDLERAFNQLGQNVIGLTHSINEQQKEGQTLNGNIGEDLFNDVNSIASMKSRVLAHNDGLGSANVSLRIDDLGALTPDEYDLVVAGAGHQVGPPESIEFSVTNRTSGNTQTIIIPDMSVSSRVEIPNSGLSLGITIIATDPPQVGKSFTLRPTRLAAQEVRLQHKDPEKVAAADAEIKTVANSENTGSAVFRTSAINKTNPIDTLYMDADNPLTISITNVNSATGVVIYDILDKNGDIVTLPVGSVLPPLSANSPVENLAKIPNPLTGMIEIEVGGIKVEMIAGSPIAGDKFTLNYNETGDGDNRNIMKMADFQNQKVMNNNKATFADIYSGMLSEIGAKTANSDVSMQSTAILKNQSFERIQSASGVNMDEEAANLLQFQQHYSAAARVISVATELFDTILQASR